MNEIGDAAGAIWRFLHERGETAVTQIARGARLSDQLVLMGLGWLAREGKITLVRDKRTLKVGLLEPRA